ncbi:unnamed protein product, partial [Allacma fusca]
MTPGVGNNGPPPPNPSQVHPPGQEQDEEEQQEPHSHHQSCPSLHTSQSISLALPKSCPSSAAVSPNSSQQLLLPLNSTSNAPKHSSSHVAPALGPSGSVPGSSSSGSSAGGGSSNSSSSNGTSKQCLSMSSAVPKHSLHPQLSGKEKTPSSSFSTRVVVSRSPVIASSVHPPPNKKTSNELLNDEP